MKKNDPRQLLAEAFLELLKKNRLEKIKVSDIVKECEASRQTFYRYFHDKHDLVLWIARQDAGYSPDAPFSRSWRESTLLFMQGIQKHQYFYSKVLRFTGQNSLAWYIVMDSRVYFSRIFELRTGRPPNDVEVFEHHATAFTFVFMMIGWVMRGFPISAEELLDRLFAYFPSSIQKILSWSDK